MYIFCTLHSIRSETSLNDTVSGHAMIRFMTECISNSDLMNYVYIGRSLPVWIDIFRTLGRYVVQSP